MKANGNFNDASLERLHSVVSGLGINRVMSPSHAFDLESPVGYHIWRGKIPDSLNGYFSWQQTNAIRKF